MQATPPSEQASAPPTSASGEHRLGSAPVAQEIEFLLARARTAGIVQANAALAPFGIKVRHYVMLSLAASIQQPSQRELAEFLHLDPSQIVSAIDVLESRGWVERTPSMEDRRIKVLRATPAGIVAHEEIKTAVTAAEDRSLKALSLEERKVLQRLLHRIAFV